MSARKSHLAVLMLAASMLGAAALVASGEGCTVLTNDALPDDAGTFEGGDAAPLDACNTCLTYACLAPFALCLTSESCAGTLDCAGDAGCVCAAGPDGGLAPDRLHHAYTACADAKIASCATDCAAEHRAPSTVVTCSGDDAGATDAGDAGGDAATDAGSAGPDACVDCAGQNCAAAVASCGSGSECEAFLACSSACTTSSCITDCGTQHATGKVAASELATCTATSCKNDCQL